MYSIGVLVFSIMLLHTQVQSGNAYISSPVSIILIFLFSVAFTIDTHKLKCFYWCRQELLLAYYWRLFLLFFDVYGRNVYHLPNSGADSSKFFRISIQVALGGKNTMGAFSLCMGTIFRWMGISQLYGQFIIMLSSMITIIVFIKILEIMDLDIINRKSALFIVGILPNFAILSVLFLREAFVTMFVSLSLYFFIKWFNGRTVFWLVLAVVADIFACSYHSGCVGIIIGIIIVLFLYDNRSKKFHLAFKNVMFSMSLAFLLTYFFLNYSEMLLSKIGNIEDVSDIANTLDYGDSTYAQYVGDSSSISNMVKYTIPRIVYFLFSPFPWQWRGLSDIIAFLFSSLFYFISIYSAVKNYFSYTKSNRNMVIAIIILTACIVFIFSWGVANTGTAARHRDKMVILIATLLALSMNRDRGKSVRESPSPFF